MYIHKTKQNTDTTKIINKHGKCCKKSTVIKLSIENIKKDWSLSLSQSNNFVYPKSFVLFTFINVLWHKWCTINDVTH